MKKIERLLLEASAYTSFILFFFLLFTSADSSTVGALNLSTFMVIYVFGVIISIAGSIFKIESIKMYVRVIIHYVTLFCAFCVVFMLAGKLWTGNSGTIFSAIAIFTFLYALTFLITYLIKKWVKSLDRKVDVIEKNKRQKIEEKRKQNEYKPLYKK